MISKYRSHKFWAFFRLFVFFFFCIGNNISNPPFRCQNIRISIFVCFASKTMLPTIDVGEREEKKESRTVEEGERREISRWLLRELWWQPNLLLFDQRYSEWENRKRGEFFKSKPSDWDTYRWDWSKKKENQQQKKPLNLR